MEQITSELDLDKIYREEMKALKTRKELKSSKQLYYTTQSLMGIHGWTWAWLIGARGRGKSFSVLDTYLNYCKKYGQDNCRCYYFRISDTSVKAMLANKGRKAIDAMLVRKYDLELTTHGNTLYNRGKPLIDFYPLVSAAKAGKGVAEYDPDFLKKKNTYIFIVIDEFMMAEGLEKKSVGNPVEQFKIYLENILRDQEQIKDRRAVMIFGCANAVSECSDFLAQLCGFIPEKPGRYVLKRKHMVIDNIPNSEAYLEKRSKSIGADIMDYKNDANYTNVVKRDLETLKPKNQQLHHITSIIKFGKSKDKWFTVWDDNVVKRYGGQTFTKSQVIAMKRYLDSLYTPELAQSVIDRYDARAFLFNDLITQATFAAELKLIKAK